MSALDPLDPDSKLVPDQYLGVENKPQDTSQTEVSSIDISSLDTNRCRPNISFIWCLPQDYNQEKHPFTCKL